jgi:hypothetical protein
VTSASMAWGSIPSQTCRASSRSCSAPGAKIARTCSARPLRSSPTAIRRRWALSGKRSKNSSCRARTWATCASGSGSGPGPVRAIFSALATTSSSSGKAEAAARARSRIAWPGADPPEAPSWVGGTVAVRSTASSSAASRGSGTQACLARPGSCVRAPAAGG